MGSYIRTLLSYIFWYGKEDQKKTDDTTVRLEAGQRPPSPSTGLWARLRRPVVPSLQFVPRYEVAHISYVKNMKIFVAMAASDEALSVSGSANLHYDELESNGVQLLEAAEIRQYRKERRRDPHDVELNLRDLMVQENLCTNADMPHAGAEEVGRWRTQFGSGRAVVTEIAVKVTDERWSPQAYYLHIEVDEVPMYQRSEVWLGDHQSILARSMAPASGKIVKEGARPTCAGNGETWCCDCNPGPNMVTVFRTSLETADLVDYVNEIFSVNGTHKSVLGGISDAPIDDDNNDNDVVHRPDKRIELESNCSLARDMVLQQTALLEINPRNQEQQAVVFATENKWRTYHKDVTRRVLFNVPFSQISRAKIRISARGDRSTQQQSLEIRVAVQCMGVFE